MGAFWSASQLEQLKAAQPNGEELARIAELGGARRAKRRHWGILTGSWVPHDTWDQIVDFVRRWANRQRTLAGRSMPIAEARRQEGAHLLPPAEDGFPLEEVIYPLIVDGRQELLDCRDRAVRSHVSRARAARRCGAGPRRTPLLTSVPDRFLALPRFSGLPRPVLR